MVNWLILGAFGFLIMMGVAEVFQYKRVFRGIIYICLGYFGYNTLNTSINDNQYDIDYDLGYNDGFAVGYNTTCEIRSTLILGEWDSQGYSRGYDFGYRDGSNECLQDRRNGRAR